MANPTIRFKRGTQSAFSAVGLNTGEPAFITDEYNFYIGVDGNSSTNKYFGSARYWTKETSSAGSGVNLVEGTSNGTHFITLASPASVGAAVTYYFPAANGSASSVLTNDGSGNLSWGSGSANPIFTGIATFNTTLVDINSDVDISGITTISNTTDSTTKDNGALVIEGGVGIEKSLNVGGNLKVTGISTFVGAVTFEGGTITLGDANTDNVVFNADVNSSILPNTDATFDIGDASVSKRWRNASFSGIVTATTFSGAATQVQTVQNSTNATFFLTFVDSDNGSATGESVHTDSGIHYNPSSNTLTVGSIIFDGGGGSITGIASTAKQVETVTAGDNAASYYLTFVDSHNATATPETVFTDSSIYYNPSTNTLTVANLTVDGTTTQVNTTSITVEDTLIELAKVDGSAPSSDANKDIGLLLHYYDSAARLGAVYWDDSASRIVLASRVGESSGVLTVDSGYYADVEFKGLYITDTAGSAEAVVSYATIGGVTGRHLQNIIVDGGTF